jgi:hypothetical protein
MRGATAIADQWQYDDGATMGARRVVEKIGTNETLLFGKPLVSVSVLRGRLD